MKGLAEQVKEIQQEMIRIQEGEKDAYRAILFRTTAIDRLLTALFGEAWSEQGRHRVTLIGQGGYGRRELCLCSDIDLLFLHEDKGQKAIEEPLRQMMQALWDAGLEVGLATRTIKECREGMEGDLTILTSLLDARYLAGDRDLYEEFTRMMKGHFASSKKVERFFEQKRRENEERLKKYGESVYLLEPHLKEGEGGLRDYHCLYWFERARGAVRRPEDLKGCLKGDEFEKLWDSLKFIWRVRNELHRRAGRRLDQLLFEHQEPISQRLEFAESGSIPGVERFMQHYYRSASLIHEISDRRIRRQGPARVPRKVDFLRDPLSLLKIFEPCRGGIEIEEEVREEIGKNLSRIDDRFRADSEAGRVFREMLARPAGLDNLLFPMNECGVLGAYLPEFEKLHFRVQHDAYHHYTVDVHSILAVGELGKLYSGEHREKHKTFSEIVPDIRRPDLLAFAILYHDIGKGEGHGHLEKGAPLIHQAALRIGFSETDAETLEFLERSHLIMTHLAFRRDLEEPELIVRFARALRNLDNLNLLCLLTFCDVKGVSPVAMTDWKASLLEYLYLKTREFFRQGAPEKISTILPRIRKTVEEGVEGDARPLLDSFFESMPPRYFLATSPSRIRRHLSLWKKLETERIIFEAVPQEKEGWNEVTVLTLDSPILFSQNAGLFAAHNINILSSDHAVSRQGIAFQTFRVTDPQGDLIRDPEKWRHLERDLRDVLQGRVRIEDLVAEKFKPSLFRKKTARVMPTRIDIDNDVSAFYTVIDLYTHDRGGLLFQITSTLAALGLYVDVSKISTKVDQVADTFYVKDIFGHRVTDPARLQKMREVLQRVIETEPTPGWKAREVLT